MHTSKYIAALFILSAGFLFSCTGNSSSDEKDSTSADSTTTEESNAEDAKIASPRKQAEGTIDGVKVVVDYGSPGVKGRKVWGGLEEWGVVWRAGANETTSLEIDKDIRIGGNPLSAGKYGVFMIPNENSDWVFILSTDWSREKHGSWGAYNYTDENDVLRLELTPEWVDENQERLQYTVDEDGVDFAWEKVRITIPIEKAGSSN